jgi:hypothetical protein
MAMTLRFSEAQIAALRERPKVEHRSMQQVVLAAVDDHLARRSITEVSGTYADRYADLLRRLGE